MKIKKGDKVIVISGKDKGTSGKVTRVLPDVSKVVVEGVNVVKKHQRARKGNEKGQIVDKAMPVHVSNVALADTGGKPTRVGYKMDGDTKVRIAKGSGKVLK